MSYDDDVERYRSWYGKLLRLYPEPYRQRFGESIAQTFNDLCRERRAANRSLFGLAAWVFLETGAGIIQQHYMHTLTKRLIIWAVIVGLLLLVPLVAMRFTTDVQWTGSDFIFAAFVLYGASLTYELVARRLMNAAYRLAVGLGVFASLLLLWINAAVGVIGNEDHPANLLYGAVFVVGFIGAIIARLRARPMFRVLLSMALAQGAVPVIALMAWPDSLNEPPGIVRLIALNGFFVTLFVGAALLFRAAAKNDPGTR